MLCFFVDRSVCRNRKYRPLFARWLRRRFLNHRWTGDHGQACRRVRNAASSPTLNSQLSVATKVIGRVRWSMKPRPRLVHASKARGIMEARISLRMFCRISSVG